MRLLVAIPVFNELKYVDQVLSQVRQFASDILCIDDGSTDGTADLLASRSDIRLIRHPSNQGYGRSVIDSFNFAAEHGFDWVITMDCDEQHEPERIPDFIREIETDRWDLISGSRYLLPSAEDDLPPGDRRAINSTITATINELFGWNLTDSFCGFKAHRTNAMIKLQLDEPGYAFPLQLWPRVARAELRLKEIPVRLIYNDPSRHFGGQLDDAQVRLDHYKAVLQRELQCPAPGADKRQLATCCCCE